MFECLVMLCTKSCGRTTPIAEATQGKRYQYDNDTREGQRMKK